MTIVGTPPEIVGAGEYGATTVHLSKDGGTLRIAFGRNDMHGSKLFYGAVLLTSEAVEELVNQLNALQK